MFSVNIDFFYIEKEGLTYQIHFVSKYIGSA